MEKITENERQSTILSRKQRKIARRVVPSCFSLLIYITVQPIAFFLEFYLNKAHSYDDVFIEKASFPRKMRFYREFRDTLYISNSIYLFASARV